MFNSSYKQEHLEIAQRIYNNVSIHPSTVKYLENIAKWYLFYEGGEGQMDPEDIRRLRERGQQPVIANLAAGFIDSLVGNEILSRYRISCRASKNEKSFDEGITGMRHLLYNIQEANDMPYEDTQRMVDQLICGISWGYLSKENGIYKYTRRSPEKVLPDPDDTSPQYTNMKFVVGKWFLSPDVIKKTWKHVLKDIDVNDPNFIASSMIGADLLNRQSQYIDFFSQNYTADRFLVVEVQRKTESTAYAGFDRKGQYFKTFDEEIAHKIADNIQEIQEIPASQIIRTLFLGNNLLETGPIYPSIPDQNDFLLIPSVSRRTWEQCVPYGIIEKIKPICQDCNSKLTKINYSLNSSMLIVQADGLLEGQNQSQIETTLKRTDGLIVLPKDSKFQYSSNASLAAEQANTIRVALELLQKVSGVVDEQRGFETNAASGVAQRNRQMSAQKNNAYIFDNAHKMKKRVGTLLLQMILGSYDENMAVQIITPEENKWMVLNLSSETDDGPQLINDVSFLPLVPYIEEVPDYKSSYEEKRELILSLINSPTGHILLRSPSLLKYFGINDTEEVMKIAAEINGATMEQGLSNNAPQNGNINLMSPENMGINPAQMINQ